METFELANLALACLVYPDFGKERVGLESRLNKQSFQKLKQHAPEAAAEVLKRRDGRGYKSTFRRDLTAHRVRERLDQRMKVARMFRPAVRQYMLGEAPPLPPGLERYSLKQLSGYVVPPDDAGSDNFLRRWLSQTLPVLHLAIAFDIVGCARVAKDQRRVDFSVHDEAFITDVLLIAIWLEPFVLNNPLRSADPATLIQLRPQD